MRTKRLSTIALLVLGASAIVCNPAGAWESRALLSSEFASSVADASGSGTGSSGASLNFDSHTNSGASKTTDVSEAYSNADAFVAVDADIESETESESFAATDIYQSLEELPQGSGEVVTGATATGSEVSGTGASAYTSVAEIHDDAGGSFAVTTAFGDASAEAIGYGSEVFSRVAGKGEANDGEASGKEVALSGGEASGVTMGYGEDNTAASSDSQLSLQAVADTNPGPYTTAEGVAVIEAWSGAYGGYSGSETETSLGVGAWANDAADGVGPEGYTTSDANAGTMAIYNAASTGYGPGYSSSSGAGGLDTQVLVMAGTADGVGVGLSEAYVLAEGETTAMGKYTESDASFYSSTDADAGSSAVGFGGTFSTTENVEIAALNDFSGVGKATSTNGDGTSIKIAGTSLANALELSTTDGVSEAIVGATADTNVLSEGEETMSGVFAEGDVLVSTGGVTTDDLASTAASSGVGGYGSVESSAFNGNVEGQPNLGFSVAAAGASGMAESLTVITDSGITDSGSLTVGAGKGAVMGYADGNAAEIGLVYGSYGDAEALAHSAGYGGVSQTITGGSVNQENLVTVGSGAFKPAAAQAASEVVIEAEAESATGYDYTDADGSTFTATAARGTFLGLDVSGMGSVDTVSNSETITGTAAAEEDDLMTGFGTAVGRSYGQGYAIVDVESFKYAADGSDPTYTTFDFDGGSSAGSEALAASQTEFFDSFGLVNDFISADGYGSAYGDATVGHAAGTFKVQPEFESTAVVAAIGEGVVGGGTIFTDDMGFATGMSLQVSKSLGIGEGYAEGTASFESPHGVDAGTYGIGAFATGDGGASVNGFLVGGAAPGDQFLEVGTGALTDASGTAGVFTEGAMADLFSRTLSEGGAEGGAGIGAVANDPELRDLFPYMAGAAAFETTTLVVTDSSAVEEGSETAFAVTDAESVTSGDVLIVLGPEDAISTKILAPELNYGVSDGGAQSSGTESDVYGESITYSESVILSPGDESTFVNLVMLDEDNTALTGGFDASLYPQRYVDISAFGSSQEFPMAGITQADTLATAVGIGTSVSTAFGTDYDPTMGEVYASSGAFGAGTAFQLAFTKADGTAVNVPGTDVQYEESSLVSLTAASTPTLVVTAGDGSAMVLSQTEGEADSIIVTEAEDNISLVDSESMAFILGEVISEVDAAGMDLFESLTWSAGGVDDQLAVVDFSQSD